MKTTYDIALIIVQIRFLLRQIYRACSLLLTERLNLAHITVVVVDPNHIHGLLADVSVEVVQWHELDARVRSREDRIRQVTWRKIISESVFGFAS